MQAKELRNITRYTYMRTAFQGWRVCIGRQRRKFTRYFSDKAFGSEELALASAKELRDRILAELQADPGKINEIFARHR